MGDTDLYVDLHKPRNLLLMHADASDAEQISNNNGLVLKYKTYQDGEVVWVMENTTDRDQYVILLRGAEFPRYMIIPYIFGDAFADVYYANKISEFIKSPNDIPIYSLAIIQFKYSRHIGFIFHLKAKSMLRVPEYGYYMVESLTGQLIPVQPQGKRTFIIFYNSSEKYYYRKASGYNVHMPFNPYVIRSYLFTPINQTDIEPPTPTQRVILQLPNSLGNIFKKIKNNIEKI